MFECVFLYATDKQLHVQIIK